MPNANLTYHIYSERSILISWQETVEDLMALRIQASQVIQNYYGDAVSINHGAVALMVYWRSQVTIADEMEQLKKLDLQTGTSGMIQKTTWELPLYYDTTTPDFLDVLKQVNCTAQELITIHLTGNYEVNFIGFLPGFPYLTGLNKRLYLPRKSVPSLHVAAGAVAIANDVCGIYTRESPGGWHVIGNCPVPLFYAKLDNPNTLKAGDKIKFYQIDLDTYHNIAQAVLNKRLVLNSFKNG